MNFAGFTELNKFSESHFGKTQLLPLTTLSRYIPRDLDIFLVVQFAGTSKIPKSKCVSGHSFRVIFFDSPHDLTADFTGLRFYPSPAMKHYVQLMV